MEPGKPVPVVLKAREWSGVLAALDAHVKTVLKRGSREQERGTRGALSSAAMEAAQLSEAATTIANALEEA